MNEQQQKERREGSTQKGKENERNDLEKNRTKNKTDVIQNERGSESLEKTSSQDNVGTQDAKQTQKKEPYKTQQDIEADQWLNRISNNPKLFLKNQFYIESKRKGTRQGSNPW